MATLLGQSHPDVSARGGGKDRGAARLQGVWTACAAGRVAQHSADRDEPAARGFHTAAKGLFGGCASDGPARTALSGGPETAGKNRGEGVQPTPQNAARCAQGAIPGSGG